MRIVFDENLSPRLTLRLQDLFSDSIHVRDVGLRRSLDGEIWNYAKDHGLILFTTDRDFQQRALSLGPPPQVVFIERCGFRFRVIEDPIRRESIRIVEFSESSGALLVLRNEPPHD